MTDPRPSLTGGKGSVVPRAEPRSYYDQPVIKPPVWTWEIPWYLFAGGMAGASSVVAVAADAIGDRGLARAARRIAGAGAVVSPVLLISDLGRPSRFHHMLRVLKPTSPMSVGSWILAGYGPAAVGSALLGELGWFPRLRRVADAVAALLGPPLATYTGALLANTAVPVWHAARHELPAVFAAGSVASAGAAVAVLRPNDPVAHRLALIGGVAEIAAARTMEQRLGEIGAPYHEGRSGRLTTAAKGLTAAGTALLALGGRRRKAASVAGAGLVLAGMASERWAVFTAGFASARDPKATVGPQRARLERDSE